MAIDFGMRYFEYIWAEEHNRTILKHFFTSGLIVSQYSNQIFFFFKCRLCIYKIFTHSLLDEQLKFDNYIEYYS